MNPAVLTINGALPDPSTLDQAAQMLLGGDVVVVPTETRYGLLVRADGPEYLKKLYEVKQRNDLRATALFVHDLKEAALLGHFTPSARRLSEAFLPGPLTLVLRAIPNWGPPRVVEGKIGLRYSPAPVVRGLLDRLAMPLTATSANVSGAAEVESVEDLASVLGDRVALYLNAGPLTGAPSTVIDCSGDQARILRAGAISSEEIKLALGELNVE